MLMIGFLGGAEGAEAAVFLVAVEDDSWGGPLLYYLFYSGFFFRFNGGGLNPWSSF